MSSINWVLVNCNSVEEAARLGEFCLRARLAGCFDIFKRELTKYFWPAKSGKVAIGRGALLVLETMPKRVVKIKKLIRKYHSDKLPFIGILKIEVDKNFAAWLNKEII